MTLPPLSHPLPSAMVMRNILWRLTLFIASIFWLSINSWGASDVIWAFWSTSLIAGYLHILTVIAAGLYAGRTSNADSEGLGVPGSLFLLAFFSLHFLGFHLVHAIFLELFFPLQADRSSGPGSLLVGVDNLWICLQNYPDFLALLLAAKLPLFVDIVRGRYALSIPGATSSAYASVVMIHLTIFLLAGAQLLDVTGPAIAVFMVFYFMPAMSVIRATIAEIKAGRATRT
ncbi:MAG: hypothetical protein CMN83_03310 [Spongiibacter sp.]|nr:hypothetical protein [Spongiibacter sp.]|tara:strand:+ start:1358 stop:2047 length:690 start_codon:yes stop_codon:yes gene_type:complete